MKFWDGKQQNFVNSCYTAALWFYGTFCMKIYIAILCSFLWACVYLYLGNFHCSAVNAHELLEKFVTDAEVLYGNDIMVYNVHCLLHLANDVKNLGCLEDFSAFSFENNEESVRKMVCNYAQLFHTHTRLTALFLGLPRWAGTRKVKPIWILLEQDSEWQWHQLGHMQVCTSLQTDNHASTPPATTQFFTGQMPFLMPSVLWCCPVKNRVVGYWRGYLSVVRCRLAYSPADATATHCFLLQ